MFCELEAVVAQRRLPDVLSTFRKIQFVHVSDAPAGEGTREEPVSLVRITVFNDTRMSAKLLLQLAGGGFELKVKETPRATREECAANSTQE